MQVNLGSSGTFWPAAISRLGVHEKQGERPAPTTARPSI